MLVNTTSWGEGRAAAVYILNSIIFAYGGEEKVEMHGIHFDMARCGDWNMSHPLNPHTFKKNV